MLKQNAMVDPENKLWKSNAGSKELQTIFKHVSSLQFEQKPDYALIKEQLNQIMKANLQQPQNRPPSGSTVVPVVSLGKKRPQTATEPSITSTKTQASDESLNKMMPPDPKRQKTTLQDLPQQPSQTNCELQ